MTFISNRRIFEHINNQWIDVPIFRKQTEIDERQVFIPTDTVKFHTMRITTHLIQTSRKNKDVNNHVNST